MTCSHTSGTLIKPRRCCTVSVQTCLRCSATLVLRPLGLEADGSCSSRHLRFSHRPQPGRLHGRSSSASVLLTPCYGHKSQIGICCTPAAAVLLQPNAPGPQVENCTVIRSMEVTVCSLLPPHAQNFLGSWEPLSGATVGAALASRQGNLVCWRHTYLVSACSWSCGAT